MNILVVPSNRADSLAKFFDAWGNRHGCDTVIVVWDGPAGTVPNTITVDDVRWYCWADIDSDLDDAWIVSRRDSAIRSFGFYKAWKLGAEHILTLDDDCYPNSFTDNLVERHISAMEFPVWVPSARCRTRGLPYFNMGKMRTKVNVGLWNGIADWDAVQTLNCDAMRAFKAPDESWIVPAGQLVPVCGMNLCFHRDAAPLMYFPLMGEGQPYARFDDIWCGVIAKRIMDHLGWSMSVGYPHIEHMRASDPMVNLVKEAPGIAFNEKFWDIVWGCNFTVHNPRGCLRELSHYFGCSNDSYIQRLGNALRLWVDLFDEV